MVAGLKKLLSRRSPANENIVVSNDLNQEPTMPEATLNTQAVYESESVDDILEFVKSATGNGLAMHGAAQGLWERS